jgi:hypothetical protein
VKHAGIAEQAATRGVPPPVGKTAGELRADGWEVRADIPDAYVLSENSGPSIVVDGVTRHPGYHWHGRRE